MVNAFFRKVSDEGNPIVWSKRMRRFSFRMCIVFLLMTICASQVVAVGFNSGSSSGRLFTSNLRRTNAQNDAGSETGKKMRVSLKDRKLQASKKNRDGLTIHDSPSWASKRGHETVDGVEYYYFTDSENDGAVLENNRKCAVNITVDRTTLILPESLGGLPLVALGSGACMNLVDVEELKFPSKLRQIGYRAFEGCSSLKSIDISGNIKSVGTCAFKSCENLSSVSLPSGIRLGDCVFEGCEKLERIVLPDIVYCGWRGDGRGLAYGLFKGCSSLKIIKIPDGVKSIGASVFEGCTSLESVELPLGIEKIERSTFAGCKQMPSIKLPDTIKEIERGAFKGCASFREVKLPYKISRIESGVFSGCASLESIIISENVETIKSYAFLKCTSLKEIVFPASIRVIEDRAFEECQSIKTVKVPESVKDLVLNAKVGNWVGGVIEGKRFKDIPGINIVIVKE